MILIQKTTQQFQCGDYIRARGYSKNVRGFERGLLHGFLKNRLVNLKKKMQTENVGGSGWHSRVFLGLTRSIDGFCGEGNASLFEPLQIAADLFKTDLENFRVVGVTDT